MPTSVPPSTFITDLRPSRKTTVEATFVSPQEAREVATRDGGKTEVRTSRVKDSTGKIGLALWCSEAEFLQAGDRVRIVEGWVKAYQGRSQIGLGRKGYMEKLASEAAKPARV